MEKQSKTEEQQKYKVYSWGKGIYGMNNGEERFNKEPVHSFDNIIFIAKHGVINDKNQLIVFGPNKKQQISEDKDDNIKIPQIIKSTIKFKQLSCGFGHILALDINGNAYSQGHSSQGALGNKEQKNIRLSKVIQFERIIYVEAGFNVSLYVDNKNKLYSCGIGNLNGSKQGKDLFTMEMLQIDNGEDYEVLNICVGYKHIGLVLKNNELWMWGNNKYCQLGISSSIKWVQTPKKVEINCKVKMISCSLGEQYGHSGCIDNQNKLYMWGSNYKYKLGHHDLKSDQVQVIPKEVIFFTKNNINCVKVVSGGIHTGVLDDNGIFYTFGCGSDGRLGHPDIGNARYLYKEKQPKPIQYFLDNNIKVIDVVSSYYQMAAMVQ